MKPAFTFKQFAICQDLCAMKVGTDGVLLGAWARVEHCKRILDIGTGTGLIALMAAQRSHANILAIDLDADAVTQASENVTASPWKERIQVLQADARNSEFKIQNSEFFFDAILCNPPFFENSLKCPDSARTMARHTDTLSFDELARSAARLLALDGELSVVIPYDRAHDMTVSCACNGLFATRQTIIVPVKGGKPKRILMAFTRQGAPHNIKTLCMQDTSRQYTPEYISLVEDFYLKM